MCCGAIQTQAVCDWVRKLKTTGRLRVYKVVVKLGARLYTSVQCFPISAGKNVAEDLCGSLYHFENPRGIHTYLKRPIVYPEDEVVLPVVVYPKDLIWAGASPSSSYSAQAVFKKVHVDKRDYARALKNGRRKGLR
jgi:hypothetical protein